MASPMHPLIVQDLPERIEAGDRLPSDQLLAAARAQGQVRGGAEHRQGRGTDASTRGLTEAKLDRERSSPDGSRPFAATLSPDPENGGSGVDRRERVHRGQEPAPQAGASWTLSRPAAIRGSRCPVGPGLARLTG